MIYVDASFYLALLMPKDQHHDRALELVPTVKQDQKLTSQATLGEVLTVGSQRFNRSAAIEFVEDIKDSTKLVFEELDLVNEGLTLFKAIQNKNISWIDCYCFAIIKSYQAEKVLSFDQHFKTTLPSLVDFPITVIQ